MHNFLKRLNMKFWYLLNKNYSRIFHNCSFLGAQIFFFIIFLKNSDIKFPSLMTGQKLIDTTHNFISLKFYPYILSGEFQISPLAFIRLKYFLSDTAGHNGLVCFSFITILQKPFLGHSTLYPSNLKWSCLGKGIEFKWIIGNIKYDFIFSPISLCCTNKRCSVPCIISIIL